MIKRIVYFLAFVVLLVSCKASKGAAGRSEVPSISAKTVIKKHYKSAFDKETIKAKLNVKYQNKENDQNIAIKLRMEKDHVIWLSGTFLGIPMAKAVITPTNFRFYEKLNKTYFEGDFKLLSDFLGTEIDFEKLQNILLGEALFDLKEQKYRVSVDEDNHLLSPKRNKLLFDVLFWINPVNFKVDKQEIRKPEKQQLLSVDYRNYKKIDGELFPKSVKIRAVEGTQVTNITIDYRKVEFNKKVSFPFKFPRGFKKINL